MKKIWQPAIALVVGGLAVAAFVTPSASAADAPKAVADSVAVHQLGAVATKWTPAAMRNAIPLDRLLPKVDASKVTHNVAKGAPQVVQPTNAQVA